MKESRSSEKPSPYGSERGSSKNLDSSARQSGAADSAFQNETEKKTLTGKVLIVQADRLGSGDMRSAVHDVFPDAQVSIVRSGPTATVAVRENRYEFAVLGLSTADLVWLDHLPTILKGLGSTPALVISGRHAPRTFRTLNKIHSISIFDPVTEGPMELRHAMGVIADGTRYMSPSVKEVMRDPREVKPELLLTLTEERVLSVIGDGCDDDEASGRLSMAEATVSTHRKHIMGKLGLHDRGKMVQFALMHGYVTKALDGSLQPGIIAILARMMAEDQRTESR